MPLGNTILSVAEGIMKGLAAIAVSLFYATVIVAWARGRGVR